MDVLGGWRSHNIPQHPHNTPTIPSQHPHNTHENNMKSLQPFGCKGATCSTKYFQPQLVTHERSRRQPRVASLLCCPSCTDASRAPSFHSVRHAYLAQEIPLSQAYNCHLFRRSVPCADKNITMTSAGF